MRLDPAIAAHGRQAEARTQAALNARLDAWRSSSGTAEVLAGLGRWGRGEEFAASPALAALFADGAVTARALIGPLMANLCAELAARPLGMIPLRHGGCGALTSVVLAREGTAALSLVVLDGATLADGPAADRAGFAPSEEHEVVLAGRATARRVLVDGASECLLIEPGTVLRRDAAREALLFDWVEGSLVLLRAQRRPPFGAGRTVRALGDGRVLAREAAPADARLEAMVALLGRMRRADAAPLIAGIALDPDHGEGLRWNALREALALDTRAGFVALSVIARDAADPLAAPAGALRASLVESWPQLMEIPCPA